MTADLDGATGADAIAVPAITRFVWAELACVLTGVVVTVTANVAVVRSALLWIVPPALLGAAVLLILANRRSDARRTLEAVALISLGNWLAAVIVPVALPFLWPVMVLVVVLPLVLAAPHVSGPRLRGGVAGAAIIAAIVALIGLSGDDGGALPDLDDRVELIVVVVALGGLMAPIALAAVLTNRSQRSALDQALRLNQELAHTQAQLLASRRRVVEAGDTARRRIERDLHDGAQQRLVAMGMTARTLAEQLDGSPYARAADRLVDDLDRAVAELRDLAHGIYPPVLASHGLTGALGAIARRAPGLIRLDLDGWSGPRPPQHIEEALFFSAAEAVTNATKHAAGAAVVLLLRRSVDEVVLEIADEGPGFDLAEAAQSFGLASIHDRVHAIGGRLTVETRPGEGTRLTVIIPAQDAASTPTP